MPTVLRPFFLSFEQALHDRLPRREIMQAMEEAMWEFDSMRDPGGGISKSGSLIRIASISLAFYRLMTKSGLPPEEAIARIHQACKAFEGPLEPAPKAEDCSLAGYFLAKNAAALCEAAFCSRCPRKVSGCPSLEALRAHQVSEQGELERNGILAV